MNKTGADSEKRRIGASLVASIGAHILLAMLISVASSDQPLAKKKAPQIMDVVLLDAKKKPAKKSPRDARTMSNQNAAGGSRRAEDRVTRRARAPLSGSRSAPRPAPPRQPRNPPVPTKDNRSRMLARRGKARNNKLTRRLKKPPRPRPTRPRPIKRTPEIPLSNLMPSAMALSELSRDFQRERRMKQKLNREADVPINTREAKYAPYAQSLVRVLEEQWRPGQANYQKVPEEARRSLMRLTIESNGDLGGVEILRPSPIPQINESALRAIQSAAPFRPLPSSWGLDRVSFYLTFEVVEDKFVFRPM